MSTSHSRNGYPYRVSGVLLRDAAWLLSAGRYGVASVLCAVFSVVYESLSHGVMSAWMILLFAYPLALGMFPALAGYIARVRASYLARQLWACGVATLTVGSCLVGVLEIYGTTSALVVPYFPVGVALLACGAVAQMGDASA